MSMQTNSWKTLLGPQYRARLVLLSLALWLHATNTMLTSTTMPSVVSDIGGHRLLSWAFSLYLIGSVVSGTQMSKLSRTAGIRNAMIGAGCLYLIGCFICAVAPNMPCFLIGRLVQGLGGGGLVSLVYLSQHQFFPNTLIPRVVVSNSVVWMVAAFTGPLIGGSFATYGLWRLAFIFFGLQALLFIAVCLRQLAPEKMDTNQPMQSIAWWNMVLLVASVLCVSVAGMQSYWFASALLVLLGVASLYWFVVFDQRLGQRRMLPEGMLDFYNPVFVGLLLTLVQSAALMSFVVYGPVVLVHVYELSPLQTGFVLITEALAWCTAALLFAGLKPAQEKNLLRIGSVLVTIGLFLQGVVVPNTQVIYIVMVLTIACAGFGASWGYLIRRVVDSAAVEDKDRASSMLPVAQQMGFAFGAAYAGVVANGLGYSGSSSVAEIQDIAPWVFFAFVPFALYGNVCAWRFFLESKASTPVK